MKLLFLLVLTARAANDEVPEATGPAPAGDGSLADRLFGLAAGVDPELPAGEDAELPRGELPIERRDGDAADGRLLGMPRRRRAPGAAQAAGE